MWLRVSRASGIHDAVFAHWDSQTASGQVSPSRQTHLAPTHTDMGYSFHKKVPTSPLSHSTTIPVWVVLILVCIAVVGFAIRIIGIDRVPTGISSDTLLYFANGRAIAETGKDIYGQLHPLYFLHKDIVAMPLTIYVIAFFYKLFGSAHIIGYLPNILMSTISIVVVGLFTSRITKNAWAGIFAAIALTFSPWHYHLSRSGFEGVFGFTLVFIGMYVSLLGLENKRYLFWSLVLLLLSTFSYKAVNIFLSMYPFVLLCYTGVAYAKTKRFVFYTLGIWCIIFLQWFLLFFLYKDSYASGILSHNIDIAKKSVETDMNLSDAPRKLKLIYSNIPLAFGITAIQNYTHFFSPQYLFTTGDTDNRFSTTGHGQLYILDGLFILLGVLWLWKQKRYAELRFLSAIIAVAPLSAMIADQQYAVRTYVSVFIFTAYIGTGCAYTIESLTRYRYNRVMIAGILAVYIFSVSVYLYRYHFLYVHYGRWSWNSNNKEVFMTAYEESRKNSQITFGHTSEFDYLDFMYWNHLPITAVQHALSSYDDRSLQYENIRFIRTCTGMGDNAALDSIGKHELLFVRDECLRDKEPKSRYYLPKLQRYTWKLYDKDSLK